MKDFIRLKIIATLLAIRQYKLSFVILLIFLLALAYSFSKLNMSPKIDADTPLVQEPVDETIFVDFLETTYTQPIALPVETPTPVAVLTPFPAPTPSQPSAPTETSYAPPVAVLTPIPLPVPVETVYTPPVVDLTPVPVETVYTPPFMILTPVPKKHTTSTEPLTKKQATKKAPVKKVTVQVVTIEYAYSMYVYWHNELHYRKHCKFHESDIKIAKDRMNFWLEKTNELKGKR